MTKRFTLLAACAVAAVAAPGAATAQTPANSDTASTAQTSDTAPNGEILVTARRRTEALQDVPISVSALSGDQLERSNVTDALSLQYRTPSLSITSGQSQRNTVSFSLRGQRTQETQLFTDPAVGTYFAEVVQPRPYGFGKSFYDLQSVQVLKGVQGTLFGRNMTGGAVLVEPNHPQLGELSGELRGQYGNYNMWDLYGVVNVPLGDKVALRVAGKTHERDGWAYNVANGKLLDNQNFDSFRVSALIAPIDGLESLTVYDWYRSDEAGTASFLTSIKLPSVISNYEGLRMAGLIDTNIPAQFAEAQKLFYDRRFTLNSPIGDGGNLDVFGGNFEKIKNWGITNKTTWVLSDSVTLKNIFGYRKERRDQVQDFDGIPAYMITPYQFARTKNISEEFQIQGKAFNKKLEYILGAYYFEEKGIDGAYTSTLPELNLLGAGLSPRTGDAGLVQAISYGEGYARTAAGFAAGTLHLTDQLSLSGGLRYNYDKRHITVGPAQPFYPNADGTTGRCSFSTAPDPDGTTAVQSGPCLFSNEKSFKEWTYDGTIQYEPSNQITLYASYRHGFRAGGFSTRATGYVTLRPFLPEFVNEYELGLKTNTPVFGNGRLTTSTALFRQDGSDVQKQRATFVGGQVYTIIDNTAKQRNSGGEFEATLSVPHFSLNAFYSYTKVEILQGAATSSVGPEIAQRGVPKHQAGFTATISPPTSESFGELDFVLNYTWRSEIFLDDFELQGRQPPYSLVNARVQIDHVGGTGASLAFFVNNALDETYRIGVLGLIAEGLGIQNSVYGEPRMFGVEVGYKF